VSVNQPISILSLTLSFSGSISHSVALSSTNKYQVAMRGASFSSSLDDEVEAVCASYGSSLSLSLPNTQSCCTPQSLSLSLSLVPIHDDCKHSHALRYSTAGAKGLPAQLVLKELRDFGAAHQQQQSSKRTSDDEDEASAPLVSLVPLLSRLLSPSLSRRRVPLALCVAVLGGGSSSSPWPRHELSLRRWHSLQSRR